MARRTIPGRLAMTAALIVAIVATTLVWVSRSDAGPIDGTWRPMFSGSGGMVGPDKPLVVFANGTWTASDGCNGYGGTFTASDSGDEFRARMVGFRTLVGCENVPNLEVL
jgi:heat shock protein HslJ